MTAPITVISELERAIAIGSPQQRAAMLMQIVDLFVGNSTRYTDQEIDLFDDIITRLAAEIEISVRSQLAQRLAPIANAPANIMRFLASDDEIKVAYPVLVQSDRVDETILVQCARSKSQDHLLAISIRKTLSEVITDVLVERGNKQVVLSAAKNLGARFSEAGFCRLVKRSDGDDTLAACVGSRPDMPQPLLLVLLETASELVRAKLIAENRHNRPDICHAVAMATNEFRDTANVGSADHVVDTQDMIRSFKDSRQLDDDTIGKFSEDKKFEEITAALAHMCDVSIDVIQQAMLQDKPETILVLAKAAKLSWPTTKDLLSSCRQGRLSSREIEQCLASFERLNFATAQRIVEFYKIRHVTGSTRPV